jgi:uncharacterized membrane protein YdjX (TVP38/TMEM64 family)
MPYGSQQEGSCPSEWGSHETYLFRWIDRYPKFKALDKAIGREGFKIILLLRLSPVFPFALSNYMYGLTAVRFWPYITATLIGFAPGTLAYVYSGKKAPSPSWVEQSSQCMKHAWGAPPGISYARTKGPCEGHT